MDDMTNITRKKNTGEPGNPGEFGTHRRDDADVNLTNKTWSTNIFDYSGVGSETVDRFPKNATEARAALRNVRGEPEEGVRAVFLARHSAPDNPEVRGPADGRPLLIVVNSGMIRLNVVSGNVVVFSGSRWGNVINTSGDATVTVIAAEGRKVSLQATGRSRITVLPEPGARGLSFVRDEAHITFEDTGFEHSMRVSGREGDKRSPHT